MENLEEFIKEIFGETASIVCQLRGGMMNESFVVQYNNKKYVLYIPTEQANEMVDRHLEEINQNLAYNVGVTSKNVYFDIQAGIKANRFIEGDSLNNLEDFDEHKIADILNKLHSSKKLSPESYHPFERLEGYVRERKYVTKDVSPLYEGIWKTILKNKQYMTSDKQVLSHNDFQRSNIIKDLDDNYWMIDFEFMANNYPLYDIACFGNDHISDGVRLLVAYKNGKPTYDDYRKFYLWRMFISLQWYNVALIKHYRGEGEAHQIDFLAVANHFIENAKNACDLLVKLKK